MITPIGSDCECGFYEDKRRKHHSLMCPTIRYYVPPHLAELRDVRRWIIDHPLRGGKDSSSMSGTPGTASAEEILLGRYKPEALLELVTAAQWVAKDYPAIAGTAIGHRESGEDRAAERWNRIAVNHHALGKAVARLNRPRDCQ